MVTTYGGVGDGFGLTQTVAPQSEPLSLAEAKLAARVEVTDDDALITDLIAVAREYSENLTGRQLLTATWALTRDRFAGGDPWWGPFWHWGSAGVIRLPKPPLQSVTSIQYVDSQGSTQTMSAADYLVDTTRDPPRLTPAWGKVWPVIRPQPNAVTITYVSGYTSATLVPRQIKLAMQLLVAHWYDRRDAIGSSLEAADRLLWQQWTGEA